MAETNGDKPAATWTEAPASATTRIVDVDGFEWLLTARANSWRELLPEVKALREALVKAGAKPANGHAAAAQPAAAAAGQAETPAGWCTIHDVQMRWHEGDDGGGWWSHKTPDGQWCRGGKKKNGTK